MATAAADSATVRTLRRPADWERRPHAGLVSATIRAAALSVTPTCQSGRPTVRASGAITGLSDICARMVTKVTVSRIRICASVLSPVVVVMALLCEGAGG